MNPRPIEMLLATLLFVPAAIAAPGAAPGAAAERARALLEEGRAQAAVDLLLETEAPAREAGSWYLLALGYHALLEEAGLLAKRGLAKKMKGALEAALERDPDHVDARKELIDFHRYAPWIVGGDREVAERQLALLAEREPGEAHALRGRYAREEGDTEAARDAYRAAIDAGPRLPERLLVLAVLEQQLDRYAESVALLDEALEAEPEMEKAHYYRARAAAMAGIATERGLASARAYVESCAECDDADRGYGWWRLATLLKRNGDVAGAADAYREALRLNPELDGAARGLAELAP